jgi:molecular chaperone DnaK
MASMINFGIDLGTSNSLIARFDRGQVEVFKNPNGFKETLPSIVGFRKDSILIGDQARTYEERDSKNVKSRFKRKMGTAETFKIKVLGASKSPVELSSYLLKELKTFVHSGEDVDSAVITIPASFDTVQCNATREAGSMAGFKTVVLLQEPIAASLAYANKEKNVDLRNSRWLVYDLGGGTFDVALVRIVEGELTVLDHEGDNYLGGTDFDALIVEKIVVPELERRGSFADLPSQLKSESGRLNQHWIRLLRAAESAKVELSAKTGAEIDLSGPQGLVDDEGALIDGYLNVSRSEFESLIKDRIEETIDMMKRILLRNSLQPGDLKFVLMVGGSTYIPFVRKRVEEILGIAVNTNIDPTSAIAVGAAYFAGTKEKGTVGAQQKNQQVSPLKIKASYPRASRESEEIVSAKVGGDTSGMHYRIMSADGAYDSGLKKLSARIIEVLPLREGAFNLFTLKVFDAQGTPVLLDVDPIQIAQGIVDVAGQMLPEDISLVTDDLSAKDTKLECLFKKNAVLPAVTKKTVEVARTVSQGSDDEILILVVEGPEDRHLSTNKQIGNLRITGKQVTRDLIKGTEIDLRFQMSESRDLTVHAYLNGTGQEFSQVFVPSQRTVSSRRLASEILLLETNILNEVGDAIRKGNLETAEDLERMLKDVRTLAVEAVALTEDDVTDKKFQLEDQKRRLAQGVFALTASKRLDQAKAAYQEARSEVCDLVKDSGNDRERHLVSEIRAREQIFMSSTSPAKIQAAIIDLQRVRWPILLRTPDFLIGMFKHLVDRRASMNDQVQAKQLVENGKRAVAGEAWDDVRQINERLWDLMPAEEQASEELRVYTGIV